MSDAQPNPYKAPESRKAPAEPIFSEPADMPDYDAPAPFWGIVWGAVKIGLVVGLIALVWAARFLHATFPF